MGLPLSQAGEHSYSTDRTGGTGPKNSEHLNSEHAHAPILERGGQLEHAHRGEVVTTADAVDAVGTDVEGPHRAIGNRTRRLGAQVAANRFNGFVRIRGGLILLPMAKDAVACHHSIHERANESAADADKSV